ncbi:MAG: TldD/PmbA family protein [Deltaproteobacteria bacterium]|nr:MAG: TldD/PmbA family protein [Deltaproteobacteria bacterium]
MTLASAAPPVSTLQGIARNVLDLARHHGATAAEVVLAQGREASFEVRNGTVDKLEEGASRSLTLRLFQGERAAGASTSDLSPEHLDRLVRDTLALAAHADPVPEAALGDPDRLASSLPDLDLHDPAIAEIPPEEKIARARELEQRAMDADPRLTVSDGASWGDAETTRVLANSHGFCEGWRSSAAGTSVSVVADDTGGRKRRGAWGSWGRHLDQLLPPDEIASTAAHRATRQIGASPIPTGRMPVVFENTTGGALLGLLFSTLTGGAIERRASWLVDRLGDTIGSPLLHVVDDPLLPRRIGSRPFDGEGAPAAPTTFLEHGTLRTYALNSYHARRLGLAPTGHASFPSGGSTGENASNLALQPGPHPPEHLIEGIERGFYCTAMMGFGFNASTGDFSRGAAGFLIENGTLGPPVSEVTLSCNFHDLWTRLDAVANDLPLDRRVATPSFRIREMTLGGRDDR